MTDDRLLERAARSWLETGPTEAPDRAIEAALSRIQTTPQERVRVPWRTRPMFTTARLVAAAIAIAVDVAGGAFLLRPGNGSTVGGPSPSALGPSAPAAVVPSAVATGSPTLRPSTAAADYSSLKGRILMEHFGNAPNGSEPSADYHPDRRRFFWMDPATMTGRTAVEFLPRMRPPGKISSMIHADISLDQKKIVFQDSGDATIRTIWVANLDGSGEDGGLQRLVSQGRTNNADPAFDPTGRWIVYVMAQDGKAFLRIKDQVLGGQRDLTSTAGSLANDVLEQPAWSPDGKKIAFGRMRWKADGVPESGTISIVDVATDKTTVLPISRTMPGDPHWSPDGTRILFTDGPLSTAGVAFSDRPDTGDIFTVGPDGSDLRQLTHTGQNITAEWTPDGRHILFFNNYFWMMNPDGSDARPVNANGDDLGELNVGFGYVGHWIDTP